MKIEENSREMQRKSKKIRRKLNENWKKFKDNAKKIEVNLRETQRKFERNLKKIRGKFRQNSKNIEENSRKIKWKLKKTRGKLSENWRKFVENAKKIKENSRTMQGKLKKIQGQCKENWRKFKDNSKKIEELLQKALPNLKQIWKLQSFQGHSIQLPEWRSQTFHFFTSIIVPHKSNCLPPQLFLLPPVFFRQERQKIVQQTWQYILHICDHKKAGYRAFISVLVLYCFEWRRHSQIVPFRVLSVLSPLSRALFGDTGWEIMQFCYQSETRCSKTPDPLTKSAMLYDISLVFLTLSLTRSLHILYR